MSTSSSALVVMLLMLPWFNGSRKFMATGEIKQDEFMHHCDLTPLLPILLFIQVSTETQPPAQRTGESRNVQMAPFL